MTIKSVKKINKIVTTETNVLGKDIIKDMANEYIKSPVLDMLFSDANTITVSIRENELNPRIVTRVKNFSGVVEFLFAKDNVDFETAIQTTVSSKEIKNIRSTMIKAYGDFNYFGEKTKLKRSKEDKDFSLFSVHSSGQGDKMETTLTIDHVNHYTQNK